MESHIKDGKLSQEDTLAGRQGRQQPHGWVLQPEAELRVLGLDSKEPEISSDVEPTLTKQDKAVLRTQTKTLYVTV